MQALHLARSLRQGADVSKLANEFLEAFPPCLDDVAALSRRLSAAASKQPLQLLPASFFKRVAQHAEQVLRSSDSNCISPAGTAALADTFARARCTDGIEAICLACLSSSLAASLAPADLLLIARSCVTLGAGDQDAIRSFLRHHLGVMAFDSVLLLQTLAHAHVRYMDVYVCICMYMHVYVYVFVFVYVTNRAWTVRSISEL